ncbi:hypothetical protein PBAC_25460 [Pedobacter glucosidilyticus]|nr:hypothetical protein [Pedobacter glucosidilyticus]KHJ37216.1 hypothetical protein PBAC_25460 [Pedobacter glucosidilyticus]
MKKFFYLLIITLTSCGSQAPKCDDDITTGTLKEIIINNTHYSILNYTMVQLYGSEYSGVSNLSESMIKKYYETEKYIKMYLDGNTSSIPENVHDAINDYINGITINNIRTNSVDETSKSCECSATLKIPPTIIDVLTQIELNYTTQRNSDGEVYVEIER